MSLIGRVVIKSVGRPQPNEDGSRKEPERVSVGIGRRSDVGDVRRDFLTRLDKYRSLKIVSSQFLSSVLAHLRMFQRTIMCVSYMFINRLYQHNQTQAS